MRLHDLIDKHQGETVWITGTGPSLDRVSAHEITGPRIHLNRTAFAFPWSIGQTYWLVIDDCWANGTPGPWVETLDDVYYGRGPIGVFRDPLLTGPGPVPSKRGPNIAHWTSAHKPRRSLLYMGRQELGERGMLYARAGTAAPAVHLAWLMGAERVVLAGVDGTDGYSKHVIRWYESPRRGGFGYGVAREDALEYAAVLGMEIEDRSTAKDNQHAHV